MTREERDEIIWLYAAGALSDAEMQTVRALLEEGDAEDLASLSAARETLARLPEALDGVEPSEEVLTRLMNRVGPDQNSAVAVAPRASSRRWILPALLTAAAACVAIISVMAARNAATENERMRKQLDESLAALEQMRRQSATEMAELRQQADDARKQSEATRVALSKQLEDLKATSAKQIDDLVAQNKLLYAANVQFTSLQGQNLPKGGGRVIWDMENRKSHLFVFDLAPLPQNKVYELWLIEPNKPAVPAGTFNVDAQGKAQIVSDIPANLQNVQIAAITIEDAPGVQVSQQQPILVGTRTPAQ